MSPVYTIWSCRLALCHVPPSHYHSVWFCRTVLIIYLHFTNQISPLQYLPYITGKLRIYAYRLSLINLDIAVSKILQHVYN